MWHPSVISYVSILLTGSLIVGPALTARLSPAAPAPDFYPCISCEAPRIFFQGPNVPTLIPNWLSYSQQSVELAAQSRQLHISSADASRWCILAVRTKHTWFLDCRSIETRPGLWHSRITVDRFYSFLSGSVAVLWIVQQL